MSEKPSMRQVIRNVSESVRSGPVELRRAAQMPNPHSEPEEREAQGCTCGRNVEGGWHVPPCVYAAKPDVEGEGERWTIGPSASGVEGTVELIVKRGPFTDDVEVCDTREVERLRLKLDNAHDALIAIEKWAEQHDQPALKERATDGLFTEIPAALSPDQENKP